MIFFYPSKFNLIKQLDYVVKITMLPNNRHVVNIETIQKNNNLKIKDAKKKYIATKCLLIWKISHGTSTSKHEFAWIFYIIT